MMYVHIYIIASRENEEMEAQSKARLSDQRKGFKTKMSKQEKSHENRVRVLEDEVACSVEMVRKSNAQKLQEIEAERLRYNIERHDMEETACGKARVEEIHAMTDADVDLKKSLGHEMVQKVVVRQDAKALLKTAHIHCQTMKIRVEKETNVEAKKSEAELAVAKSRAVSACYCERPCSV